MQSASIFFFFHILIAKISILHFPIVFVIIPSRYCTGNFDTQILCNNNNKSNTNNKYECQGGNYSYFCIWKAFPPNHWTSSVFSILSTFICREINALLKLWVILQNVGFLLFPVHFSQYASTPWRYWLVHWLFTSEGLDERFWPFLLIPYIYSVVDHSTATREEPQSRAGAGGTVQTWREVILIQLWEKHFLTPADLV